MLETVFGLKLCAEGFYLAPNMAKELDGAELSLDIRGTRYRVRYFFCEQSGAVLDGKILENDIEKMKKLLFELDGCEHTVDFCIKKED